MKQFILPLLCCFTFQIIAQNNFFSINQLIGNLSSQTNAETKNLQPEVYTAFLKMKKEALKENIHISIASGFRNFNRQKLIFERKYNRYQKQGFSKIKILNKIIEYSTIPGTSRHHWGTDIDIVQKVETMPKNLLVPSNYSSEGPFCRMKEWMDANANTFGFYLVYTENINRTGFKYEPWHYTYAPISKKLLIQFLEKNIEGKIYSEINQLGVQIDTTFFKKYITSHIKGINKQLLTP